MTKNTTKTPAVHINDPLRTPPCMEKRGGKLKSVRPLSGLSRFEEERRRERLAFRELGIR